MPEYLSPGVYVEEFKIGAQPIEGVSTSTAAFVGIAEKGPLNKPTLVTSQKDFVSTFGGYIKDSYLAYAVDGFFRNGGKRCFIVRVAHDASSAYSTFKDKSGTDLMKISAVNEGEWGKKINITIQEASSGSTTLFLDRLSEDAKGNSIKLSNTIGLSKGSSIVINGGSNSETLTVESLDSGFAPDRLSTEKAAQALVETLYLGGQPQPYWDALEDLIAHPLVRDFVNTLLRDYNQRVIVTENILYVLDKVGIWPELIPTLQEVAMNAKEPEARYKASRLIEATDRFLTR